MKTLKAPVMDAQPAKDVATTPEGVPQWVEVDSELTIPANHAVTRCNLDVEEPYCEVSPIRDILNIKKVLISAPLAYYLVTHSCGSESYKRMIQEMGMREILNKLKDLFGDQIVEEIQASRPRATPRQPKQEPSISPKVKLPEHLETDTTFIIPARHVVKACNFDDSEPYCVIDTSGAVPSKPQKLPFPKPLAAYLSTGFCGSQRVRESYLEQGWNEMRAIIVKTLGKNNLKKLFEHSILT